MILFVFDTREECDKFTILYEKYRKIVLYTISLFVKDKFTAEDLLQEIYMRIGKNLQKIDLSDEKRSRNYIITIARNHCRSYLARQNKTEEEPIEDIDEADSLQDDVLDNLIHQECFNHLVTAIEKLEEHYKSVLELKYIMGLSDGEIADFLQIQKKTVQMRLYRAKNKLRKEVCNHEEWSG